MSEHDLTFQAMGSHVRLLVGEPGPGMAPAAAAAEQARRFVEEFDATLSRFKPESELSRLNADERERVPASELMRRAVEAGVFAAERSDGLVDPTLVGEIEGAGYVSSRAGTAGLPLGEALADAPARRPAQRRPDRRWSEFAVDDAAGEVVRPPGLRFDTGGTGKGLAADMVAATLRGYSRFIVDCGGDIRIGGADALVHPYEVFVEHPITGARAHVLRLGSGGVATSGINVRIWRDADGRFAHHLLDPASGEPAWTGLVGATALGDTALEAETLSKAALLSGPEGGRRVLAERGGFLIHDSGRVELVGSLAVALRVRLPEVSR
ncbi:MAG TPA: FAD:protein FMN transferase [Solirubrobacterales bacterium]|jgi:thiamine biosynthesis lipoprotein|nr:FAD:protein FMN transferase [Solirubrobacterales bacterium]